MKVGNAWKTRLDRVACVCYMLHLATVYTHDMFCNFRSVVYWWCSCNAGHCVLVLSIVLHSRVLSSFPLQSSYFSHTKRGFLPSAIDMWFDQDTFEETKFMCLPVCDCVCRNEFLWCLYACYRASVYFLRVILECYSCWHASVYACVRACVCVHTHVCKCTGTTHACMQDMVLEEENVLESRELHVCWRRGTPFHLHVLLQGWRTRMYKCTYAGTHLRPCADEESWIHIFCECVGHAYNIWNLHGMHV